MLTANEKRKLRHLWKGDSTIEEILDELGFTPEQLESARVFLGLPRDEDRECKAYLPTPEQIRIATAEIRSRWSQSEREERIRAAWGGTLNGTKEDDARRD